MPRVGSSRINTCWPHCEPFAEDDFLLIAAGKIDDFAIDRRRFDPHSLDLFAGDAIFGAALEPAWGR